MKKLLSLTLLLGLSQVQIVAQTNIKQAIELKSNTQLVTEAIEELDDLIVYAVVLRSRMDNLRLSI
jgi:hypothetical protein